MKQKIIKIQSTAIPLPIENIDTDQICPARFLKALSRENFGDHLFRDWRNDKNFVLNSKKYSGEILVAGKNFGCGSSREHAVWALVDYGFKAVISSFFADIFKNNALNNSILPVQISENFLRKLFHAIDKNSKTAIDINLEKQEIIIPILKLKERFEINSYKKICFMNGYDDIDYLLQMKSKVESYEKNNRSIAR